MVGERRRLWLAALLSVLLHMLFLSLSFGGQGLGLPGFGLPWRERRVEVPDLRYVLLPAPSRAAAQADAQASESGRRSSIEPPAAGMSALTLTQAPAPAQPQADKATGPKAKATARANPASKARPRSDGAAGAAATAASRSKVARGSASLSSTAPAMRALARPERETPTVPVAPDMPLPVLSAAPIASSPRATRPLYGDALETAPGQSDPEALVHAPEAGAVDRSQLEAARAETARLEAERQETARRRAAHQEAEREETARQEAQRLEMARLEAERQEGARLAAARQEAEQQDARRIEAARLEAQRLESARVEAERHEAQRIEAARLEAEGREAARQELARQEARRIEAARLEAQRIESARLEAERQKAQRIEAVRLEAEGQAAAQLAAARQEAARVEAAQAVEARREARRRAIGRQLDEEAARRDAASTSAGMPPSRLAPSSSGARRGRLFGRTDTNAELVLYAEAWARKIQLNMTFDMIRELSKRPHTHPMVTVAIRRDGSVESVTFVLSSGVAEIDEAIRRIVQSQLPYQEFPPALAREFDVIEIRRTWHFDMAIRLY